MKLSFAIASISIILIGNVASLSFNCATAPAFKTRATSTMVDQMIGNHNNKRQNLYADSNSKLSGYGKRVQWANSVEELAQLSIDNWTGYHQDASVYLDTLKKIVACRNGGKTMEGASVVENWVSVATDEAWSKAVSRWADDDAKKLYISGGNAGHFTAIFDQNLQFVACARNSKHGTSCMYVRFGARSRSTPCNSPWTPGSSNKRVCECKGGTKPSLINKGVCK